MAWRKKPTRPAGEGLTDEERYERALDAAARTLACRPLSAAALEEKLCDKGYGADAAGYAAAWMVEHGYLDDARYAAQAVESYTRRGYGVHRIRQELRRRGVDEDTAQEALSECEADPAVLHALLEKRLHGDLSDRKAVDRAVAALQRRGYRWEDIRRALRAYGGELDEDWS